MKKTFVLITLVLFANPAAAAENAPLTVTIDEPGQVTTLEVGNLGGDPLDLSFMDASYVSPAPAILSDREKMPLELAQEWKENALKPALGGKGKVSFVYGHTIPTIIVAPYQVADLEMQPGEKISSIVLGDTARWHVEVVNSGTGSYSTSHIAFKTIDSGISTTALITTDRRAYHIKLKSDRKEHMAYTGFLYPHDTQTVFSSAVNQEEPKDKDTKKRGFDPVDLDFQYTIKGKALWRPVQVYNDGKKTYIRMPEIQEMPVLLVKTAAGQGLVNYRVKDSTFVVDQVFEEGYLIVGLGKTQEKITIRHKEA
ncbi:P-type conjugative transfer protein TrbG [Desulforhopalus singaporensis]|uniref:Type IV secretion system protein VirB9 n=1 Tax=Desulforhopalus singaporensis TaxID=91360 RepID=A0A1H0PA99_9BACT|nr:P-type conjugative transfer protein TrbG [Desulforhopalus singaporensis]SDP01992.1 type IV secretion system protein VirB9 [Desulforhopalus singaporensis]